MKKLLMGLSLVVGLVGVTSAHADVKAKGTVLDSECGNANKSTQVCLANVVGAPDSQYLVLRPFKRNPLYLRVTSVSKAAGSAAAPTTYTALFAALDPKSGRMFEHNLTLTRSLSKDKQSKADVVMNGKSIAKDMVLEPVILTQSLGSEE